MGVGVEAEIGLESEELGFIFRVYFCFLECF